MFAPKGMGYDRGSTIFSPDGRLFQVEYAIEAVKRGTTAIGVRTDQGCCLAVEKRFHTPLIEKETVKKIFMIDDHIAAATAGLTADARVLVEQARVQAQIHRLTYNEEISVEMLTKKIANIKQLYTSIAGVRPFGVSFLIAGVDQPNENHYGPKLFMTEPSGSYWGYKSAAIGSGAPVMLEMMEEEYSSASKTLQSGILYAIKNLNQLSDGQLDANMIEIATIDDQTRRLKYLSENEVSSYINQLQESKSSA